MAEADTARTERPRRLSRTVLSRLKKPLAHELVSERATDDGTLLRYLEGWRAIAQANAIFGHDRWGAELVGEVAYRPLPAHGRARGGTPGGLYTATVRITIDGGLAHSDVGAATVSDPNPEAHAVAYKAAVTDALKRALRHFGDQFGNALWAGAERDELAPLDTETQPDDLRAQVLQIAASAGSDAAHTREWVEQRYGCTLEELEGRSLADAIAVLSRGLDRRNGAQAA